VGRWNQLVSTTNWEKGRIICQWRAALIERGAPSAEYSDEAWSQHVRGVTGQHVGRLRRVYQRFGDVYGQYETLFWSHFQAAIDWNDAEMWLEGAIQNGWSISQMRRARWETLDEGRGEPPSDDEIAIADLDEDFAPPTDVDELVIDRQMGEVRDPDAADMDANPETGRAEQHASPAVAERLDSAVADDGEGEDATSAPPVRPFEDLEDLPEDLHAAFEAFKLAILRHKADNWRTVRRDDVLASLDALKQLALTQGAD
jgi:hypothetical protein